MIMMMMMDEDMKGKQLAAGITRLTTVYWEKEERRRTLEHAPINGSLSYVYRCNGS